MGITIKKKSRPDVVHVLTPSGYVERPAKKVPTKRMKPQAPEISLSQPGRLRVANLLSLFAVSRTTLYAGINSGRYPEPDGRDGRLPYWNTETVRRWLEEGK